jgi:hypothetical protein
MSLEHSAIEKITQRVCREYPEMRCVRPSVSESNDRFTLIYKTTAQTPAGPISRVVRVVADKRGKVLRLSTSK